MKEKLLSDHKKVGKVFQPPILALGSFVETAWLDFGIPEFIWIHILCEECGVDEGSLLFLEFTKIVDSHFKSKLNNGTAAAILSSYSLLLEKEKNEILLQLQSKAILPRLKHILTPFLCLYPECPLNFILKKSDSIDLQKRYLPKYKEYLKKLMDKTSFGSTIVMANVINFLNHLDRLKIAEGNKLPQLKEILNYPNTENSKRMASFLRSTISMCFNKEWDYNRENEWIKYFWNQSLALEPYTL